MSFIFVGALIAQKNLEKILSILSNAIQEHTSLVPLLIKIQNAEYRIIKIIRFLFTVAKCVADNSVLDIYNIHQIEDRSVISLSSPKTKAYRSLFISTPFDSSITKKWVPGSCSCYVLEKYFYFSFSSYPKNK
jgi:hypothetical protein